jgi:acyl-coenzyme A thioesterase PaaI-like protein
VPALLAHRKCRMRKSLLAWPTRRAAVIVLRHYASSHRPGRTRTKPNLSHIRPSTCNCTTASPDQPIDRGSPGQPVFNAIGRPVGPSVGGRADASSFVGVGRFAHLGRLNRVSPAPDRARSARCGTLRGTSAVASAESRMPRAAALLPLPGKSRLRLAGAGATATTVSYLNPTPIARVTARGEVLRFGSSSVVMQGSLRAAADKLLAAVSDRVAHSSQAAEGQIEGDNSAKTCPFPLCANESAWVWRYQRAARRVWSGVSPYMVLWAVANRPRWVNPQRCAMAATVLRKGCADRRSRWARRSRTTRTYAIGDMAR